MLLKLSVWFVLCSALVFANEEVVQKEKPIILILLGPPGSGRDLLAVRVSSSFSLPYISAADLLLDYSTEDSDMGRQAHACLQTGEISDDCLLKLLSDRIKNSDCSRGFLLEGFPKDESQAKALKAMFQEKYRIVPAYVRSSEEWLVNFHEGRLVCKNCGRVYHTDRSPPKTENECDSCDIELVQRDDDTPESVRKRMESYRAGILPLLSYYKQERLLIEIDGTKTLEDMIQEVKNVIAPKYTPRG